VNQGELVQAAAAAETLNRVRKIWVRFRAGWTRLDDLEPEAEQALKAALQAAWDTWAGQYGITGADVRGPDVTVHKLDYVPSIDGELDQLPGRS